LLHRVIADEESEGYVQLLGKEQPIGKQVPLAEQANWAEVSL